MKVYYACLWCGESKNGDKSGFCDKCKKEISEKLNDCLGMSSEAEE
jgi:hypothetical protein